MNIKGQGQVKERRIRILYISRKSNITGAENIMLDIVKNLELKSFYPIVVLPDRNGLLYKKLVEAQIETLVVRMPFLRVTRNPFLLAWFSLSILAVNTVFFFLLARKRIDIVSCHTIQEAFYIAFPTKLLGKKLILSFKNILDNPWKKKIRARFASVFADKVIAVSQKAAADFSDFYSRARDLRKLAVVHDCLSYGDFVKDIEEIPLERFFKSEKDDFVIANIGSLSELKGQALLVESAAKVRLKNAKIKVLLIGDIYDSRDTPYKEKLIDMIKLYNLKDTVFLAGYQQNVKGILANTDAVVHCPVIDDAFPRAILEGFAMKNIVIATKTGGIPEIITDNYNGFLSDISSDALSERISYIYENRYNLSIVKENALKTLREKFSLEKQVKAMENLYKNLIQD